MPSPDALLVLDAADDVAVARRVLVPGEVITVGDTKLTVRDEVTIGHKIALRDIAPDTPVTKYGYQIGLARQPIKAGQHVHLHNLAFSSHATSVASDFGSRGWSAPQLPERTTFLGAARSDGSTATRNYIAVLSTVNCSANVCEIVANEVTRRGLLADHPNVDGVIPLVHTLGCGMSSEGLEVLQRTLAGFRRPPQRGRVVVIGRVARSTR